MLFIVNTVLSIINCVLIGGEYIQKLHIKNVSTSVKKLKYRLPSTRYFSLAYPEVNSDSKF